MSCILIAGAIGSGKTTIAEMLCECPGAELVRVRQALIDVIGSPNVDRALLQRRGAELDQRTNGRWLSEYVLEVLGRTGRVVVDSLRTERQTLPLLATVPSSVLIFLEAHRTIRQARYTESSRHDVVKARTPFELAMLHPTESEVTRLRNHSDLIIETDDLSPSQVVRLIRDHVGRQ